jgi:uncharacterized repeat protein (TIGR01451 family)
MPGKRRRGSRPSFLERYGMIVGIGRYCVRTIVVYVFLALLLLTGVPGIADPQPTTLAAPSRPLQAPVLKWQLGGCYPTWCETGWYSSPAVVDLDNDGSMEVIGVSYSLFAFDGEDGSVLWSVARPEADVRVTAGVVVADLDGDEDLEIVTAHGQGYVRVLDHNGGLVWQKQPTSGELRSLAVADLDGDGDMEIAIGRGVLDQANIWVLEHDGSLRPGWPQLSGGEGAAAGMYNDNIGLGDLDGDGVLEVVAPSDTLRVCAYEPDGSQIETHEMYHGHPEHDMDRWGEVPAYVELAYEVQGWGPCSEQFTARGNFANGPANVVDVNGDGINEVVVTGDVHDCHPDPNLDLYNGPYIFNGDRSRFQADGFDWTTLPVDAGAPLSQEFDVIAHAQPNPVTVDLDGDGFLEILYPSYDGRMHAFWLDKTEHGNWPYSVYNAAEGIYRYASEPVVADLDADGYAEVIFASWVQKGSYQTGKLHILDYLGNPLHEVDLPPAHGDEDWNGALAAPTLGNLDADAELELVLNTAHSGFVAYDLPGTERARVRWGTGRGNYQRTGSIPQGTLRSSSKQVRPIGPGPGDVLNYTIRLENSGPGLDLTGAHLTDTLPVEVHYLGDLWASSGSYSEEGGTITWEGEVPVGEPVTITFDVSVSQQVTMPHAIENLAYLNDGEGHVLERRAVVIANGYDVYLPIILQEAMP